jgi:hypothetical protein
VGLTQFSLDCHQVSTKFALDCRISLRTAVQIIYAEARAAARRTRFYGERPPSIREEKLGPLQLKYGTVKNGARAIHMNDSTQAVFTNLQVETKELRRALREVRENLKTATPI